MSDHSTPAPFAIPPIPALVAGPLVEPQEPVLLWVHTGAATIETEESRYRLTAGQALWVPPGVEHCTRTDEGAVVFPLFLRPAELGGELSSVRLVTIPPDWEQWLVHRWDDNSYTREALPGSEQLLRLVAQHTAADRGASPQTGALPLPHSREALHVARSLLRNPGLPRGVEAFAARENVSGKTLQRQFVRETGMTFSLWRTRARIAVAARHLTEGRDIGWTGRCVGYATPTGFTKAFRRHAGITPSDYSRRHAPPDRGAMLPNDDGIDDAVALAIGEPATAPQVPARAFWGRVNPFHELMWVYRGRVLLRIGTHHRVLGQGQAIWIPAGLTHSVEFTAGSLMMTLGTRHGRVHAGVDELIVFAFPPEAEPFLFHTMLSEYTLFRPASGAGALTSRLFYEQFRARRAEASGLTGVLGEIAVALRRDPADRRSLAEWAAQMSASPEELGRTFMAQTGECFPKWRARIRMDVARDLLRLGAAPGQVFRQLGYSSPAAFTRAFAAAHGISPRDYQRRETRRAELRDAASPAARAGAGQPATT